MVLCEAALGSEALLLAQHHFKAGTWLLWCRKARARCCRTAGSRQRPAAPHERPQWETSITCFKHSCYQKRFKNISSVCSSICLQNFSCALYNAFSTMMITKAMLSFHFKSSSGCQNQEAKPCPSHWWEMMLRWSSRFSKSYQIPAETVNGTRELPKAQANLNLWLLGRTMVNKDTLFQAGGCHH